MENGSDSVDTGLRGLVVVVPSKVAILYIKEDDNEYGETSALELKRKVKRPLALPFWSLLLNKSLHPNLNPLILFIFLDCSMVKFMIANEIPLFNV